MGHMVHGHLIKGVSYGRSSGGWELWVAHMAIDAVLGKLVGHDASCSIVDHDVDSIRLAGNLVCRILNGLPIRQITLEPDNLVCSFPTHLFFHCVDGAINDLLRDGKDEELVDIVGEHGIGASISDALATTGDDCNFAAQ